MARQQRVEGSNPGGVPGLRSEACALLAPALLLALCLPSVAAALPVTLVDDNAAVSVDPDSQEGISAWTVAGLSHVRQQWYWLRVGQSGGETSLDQLDHTGTVLSDTNGSGSDDTFFAAFVDPLGRFTAELRVVLEGGAIGSPATGAVADLDTQLALTNTSGGALDITLFQYTDVDLFNTFADDALAFGGNPANTVGVTDDSGLGRYEAVFTPGASAIEAAVFGPLLAELGDGAPTLLGGSDSVAGDVTHAIAWSLSLPNGGAFILSHDQSITVDPVPEPALPLLGLAALAARALNRRKRGTA